LGIGIGLVLASLIMMAITPGTVQKSEVEKKARALGMVYPDEVKALYDNSK
jgi:hypothetical protein